MGHAHDLRPSLCLGFGVPLPPTGHRGGSDVRALQFQADLGGKISFSPPLPRRGRRETKAPWVACPISTVSPFTAEGSGPVQQVCLCPRLPLHPHTLAPLPSLYQACLLSPVLNIATLPYHPRRRRSNTAFILQPPLLLLLTSPIVWFTPFGPEHHE